MEEEILVVDEEYVLRFNFPKEFFAKHLKGLIERGLIRPLKLYEVEGEGGSKRVVLETDPETGVELRAWLLIKINEETDYFLTEVGPRDVPCKG